MGGRRQRGAASRWCSGGTTCNERGACEERSGRQGRRCSCCCSTCVRTGRLLRRWPGGQRHEHHCAHPRLFSGAVYSCFRPPDLNSQPTTTHHSEYCLGQAIRSNSINQVNRFTIRMLCSKRWVLLQCMCTGEFCEPSGGGNVSGQIIPCPANKYQQQQQPSMSSCKICEAGKYQNDGGQPFCESVSTFRYVRKINSTCAVNTACPKAPVAQNAFDCSNLSKKFGTTACAVCAADRSIAPHGSNTNTPTFTLANVKIRAAMWTFHLAVSRARTGATVCSLCSQCTTSTYFKEPSMGNCVRCGSWAAVETPLIVVLTILTLVLVLFAWWKILAWTPCRCMKAWKAKGACCLRPTHQLSR